MATKEFRKETKELIDLLKKLSNEVPDTSNSSDFFKYLTKTRTIGETFNKDSPTHVDYVARAISKKSKTTEKKSQKATQKTPKASKSKAENDDEKKPVEEEKKKVTKPQQQKPDSVNIKKRKAEEDPDEPTKKKVKNSTQ